MNLHRSLISIFLFFICFSSSSSAQIPIPAAELDEVVIIGANADRWRFSKEGQEEHYKNYSPNIIPDYFVLGTLHFFILREGNLINLFNPYEKPLVDFLRKYIQEKFNFRLQVGIERREYVMYSSELTEKIRTYYDKKGILNDSIFKSDEEICSYLLGVYYRYGYKVNDSIYKIELRSSYDKLVYTLLKKINNCNKIFHINSRCYGGKDTFYFEPSVLLKKYFDTIESEKTKLDKSYIDFEWTRYGRKDDIIHNREKERETIESLINFL